MKQGGKYLLILILFLLPGIGLFSKDTVAERLLDGGQAATVNITHQSITSSQDIYSAMMDTFSSICRVETIKIEGRDYCRDFFRLAFIISKNFRIPVKSFLYTESYKCVLAERYVQGAYIYFHKLII